MPRTLPAEPETGTETLGEDGPGTQPREKQDDGATHRGLHRPAPVRTSREPPAPLTTSVAVIESRCRPAVFDGVPVPQYRIPALPAAVTSVLVALTRSTPSTHNEIALPTIRSVTV